LIHRASCPKDSWPGVSVQLATAAGIEEVRGDAVLAALGRLPNIVDGSMAEPISIDQRTLGRLLLQWPVLSRTLKAGAKLIRT
jgi:hypothetical protein